MNLNYSHVLTFRVRYSETDRMGYCYHGNYATYFELGRVEALRSLGVVYKVLEDEGILLPVVSMSTKFKAPALYDDLLRLETRLVRAENCTLEFSYSLFIHCFLPIFFYLSFSGKCFFLFHFFV